MANISLACWGLEENPYASDATAAAASVSASSPNTSNINSATAQIPEWKSRARKHREYQQSLIVPEWRIDPSQVDLSDPQNTIHVVETHLSPEEREITALDQTLSSLQSAVRSRRYSAVQVTRAFCHRAALLQQLTKCLTEVFFESALQTAREQDEYFSRTGEFIGPLHGIPLSIKDNHMIKGVDTTMGWVAMVGKPADEDHPGVAQYRKLGAIFYCKTNLPQSMMMSDSYNHLYGQSVNSLDRRYISGGSSGGEAALIGAGGSIVGIGTDIGGSVRIPAALQGLYGLSPTIGRFPNAESRKGSKYIVPPVAGPMTRDLASLESFMNTYISSEPWTSDPGIHPILWRHDQISSTTNRPLRIAYLTDDGAVRCHPPIVRAVLETISKLTRAGHECISWNDHAATLHARAYDLWLKAVLADGGSRMQALQDMISEPLIPGMLVGQPHHHLSLDARIALADDIFALQHEYLHLWHSLNLDALIAPVTQWVALKPKMWVQADMYVGYTSFVNLLNWTSLAVPAGRVDRDKDSPDEEWREHKPRSESDRYNHAHYDVEAYEGLPVGVQIVTGRFGEEKACAIARILDGL